MSQIRKFMQILLMPVTGSLQHQEGIVIINELPVKYLCKLFESEVPASYQKRSLKGTGNLLKLHERQMEDYAYRNIRLYPGLPVLQVYQ